MRVDYRTTRLGTRRLIVRPLRLSDHTRWVRAQREMQPRQTAFDVGPRPTGQLTRDEFRKLVGQRQAVWARDRFYALSVFERRAPGDLVGMVNVIPHIRSTIQTAAVGYVIHNNHWGKGYATEALAAVVTFAFETLRFHRLSAEMDTRNRPSVATAKKAGFRREGTARGFLHDGERWRDAYIFAMTAEEWGIEGTRPEVRMHFSES